jgi:hypothetical protein
MTLARPRKEEQLSFIHFNVATMATEISITSRFSYVVAVKSCREGWFTARLAIL